MTTPNTIEVTGRVDRRTIDRRLRIRFVGTMTFPDGTTRPMVYVPDPRWGSAVRYYARRVTALRWWRWNR